MIMPTISKSKNVAITLDIRGIVIQIVFILMAS